MLGVLEKLALLSGGLTIHACGVGRALGADAGPGVAVGGEVRLRSMGNEL